MKQTFHILLLSVACVLACASAQAKPRQYADSAIYQGMHVRLDVGNMALQLGMSKGLVQQYEGLINANLLNKYYPTLELGYMNARGEAAGGGFAGQGAFTRIGVDLNPIRKRRNGDYFLSVGIRAGFALQDCTWSNVNLNDTYWGTPPINRHQKVRFDSWGEVVAGLNVKVVGGFTMGWALRIHFLFTGKLGPYQPYYIPGFGQQNGGNFGFNYYLGWRF